MLYLISIGLWDEKDLSIRAIEESRKCQKLYAEFYTSNIATSTEKLSHIIGKPVIELKRTDLEEGAERILSQAKKANVGILVPGDCLTATTHISLVLEAKKAGIPVKIVHGSSILTAIGQTGLSLYKFGRISTLPKTGCPQSVKKILIKNKKVGLHSLILLDIGLKVSKAINILINEKIISKKSQILIAGKLGAEREIIKYGPASQLSKIEISPAVIIIPAHLHFIEKEFLSFLR
jgi:diphthine synthase